jgi:hypothetical protein
MSKNSQMQLCFQEGGLPMNKLDASAYAFSKIYYYSEFEELLGKITLCYNDMVASDCQLPNDENKIRDYLYVNYLNNDNVLRKYKFGKYKFDKEIVEDFGEGRVDIRIISPNIFENKQAYYIIECKRIDNINTQGNTGLNAEYVINGMNRFLKENKYSSFYGTNGLIGFIVSTLDINANIRNINTLIKKHIIGNCIQDIKREDFMPNFPYQYSSNHTKQNGEKIKLYHLMYDFADKVLN